MASVRRAEREALVRRGKSESDVRAALDALRRIIQALRLAAPDASRRGRLSSAQLFALQQIAEHPGASVNDVAKLTFTHQSSVSVVIQRLVARGLVAKVAVDQDRRRQRLDVTPRGRRALTDTPVAVQERLIGAIAGLASAKRRALAGTLATVARAVTTGDAGAHPPMLLEENRRRSRSRSARRA
ncbi:MAG TPA: MarR family winged helix-turn-helix transcriptional regulator [Vicinamibacterales bacterium]